MIESPPPLDFRDPGSFATRTLEIRFPKILDGLDVPRRAGIRERLERLRASVPDGRPPRPRGRTAERRAYWERRYGAGPMPPWRRMTFFEAEFVLYTAIEDAICPVGSTALDPFAPSKEAGWDAALAALEAEGVEEGYESPRWSRSSAREAMLRALWGNRADLSQEQRHHRANTAGPLWVDDMDRALDVLERARHRPTQVEFLADNAGEELSSDLRLIDFLLRTLPGLRIRVHVKPMPMFVSDTTRADWRRSLDEGRHRCSPSLRRWFEGLRIFESAGRLEVVDPEAWGLPFTLAQLPSAVTAQLASASLIVAKGDLNYRRLVEDRAWEPTRAASLFAIPGVAPVLALRTLKSELVVGLSDAIWRDVRQREPDALVSGRNALVQYFDPGP